MGENTSVLTLQNGVESYEELSQAVGRERVLPGAAYIETQIESPGVIRQRGDVCASFLARSEDGRRPGHSVS